MSKSDIELRGQFVSDIREIIADSKNAAIRSVDFERVKMYWRLGERIIVEEQRGKERAEYGTYLLRNLATQIEPEFGSGFSVRQLERARQFYRTYPIASTVRTQFNWSQYRLLIQMDNEDKREYYELEALNNNWTARELERQINSGLYERLLVSCQARHDTNIKLLKVPCPPKEVQEIIIREISKIEVQENNSLFAAIKAKKHISEIIDRLSNIATLKDYFKINTDSLDPKREWADEYFTYVDIDSVGKNNGKICFEQKILGKESPSRARRVAQEKTAIISTVRPYLKGFAYLETVPPKTIFSTGFALIKSKSEKGYITKFLYYLFRYSTDLMEQMNKAMPKSAYPSINSSDIENFRIPFPIIAEQQKIVTEIEELEKQIATSQKIIDDSAERKSAILKKYL